MNFFSLKIMKHTEQLQPRPSQNPRNGTISVQNKETKENGGRKCCGGGGGDDNVKK
jgi:hypothetical protein